MSQKRRRYFIVALIALIYSIVSGYLVHRKHVVLEQRGVIAEVSLDRYGKSDFDGVVYAHYSFRTPQGQVVSEAKKTSEERDYYERLRVVYDPRNPETFEELPGYERYSTVWTVFFFGVLMPTFMTVIFGGFASVGSAVRRALNDDSRGSFKERLTRQMQEDA